MKSADASFSTGHPGADAVERGLALLCLGLCAGSTLAFAGGAALPEALWMIKVIACLTLAGAAMAIWLTNQIEDVPGRSFGNSAARWLAQLQDRLMPGAGVLSRLERSRGSRQALVRAVEVMAGSDVDMSREIARSMAGIGRASGAFDQVVDRTRSVASCVRSTTAELATILRVASGLAEAAYAARSVLLTLSSRTAPFSDLADRLHQDLRAMSRQLATLHTVPPEAAYEAMRSAAASAMATLDMMLSKLVDLAAASEGSIAQVERMAALIVDQHRAGAALAGSIEAQGSELTTLLLEIGAAGPALMAARAGNETASAIESARHHATRVVWQEAATIPGRAETIALLLKDLPGVTAPGPGAAAHRAFAGPESF